MSAYQVLARKWRPKTFADLVGQEHVVKALQNALEQGRLHHAYLLTGTRGVGKTTIARILAKSLNCEQPSHGEPCGVCPACRDIDAGRFVDLLEIDAASNTGIDNIREVLENAQYAPTAGKYKVYIIDEVHMLSKSAFNAMLKTLEEPPEHVKFILATTDPHKVPVTVLSRCLQFVLRNMTAQQVSEHLARVLDSEGIDYEAAALSLLGRAAAGSMRDALSLLDQAIALGSGRVGEADVRHMIGAVDKRYLYDLLEHLMQHDGAALVAKAQEMAANAVGFDSALADLSALLQQLALFKSVPAAIAADDPEYERLLHLSQYFSDEQIQLYYQCLIHGRRDLPLAPDEYAGFVMTLLRMLAFAPFAAKHTPEHAVIEGTQLHNPEAAAKKPHPPETETAPTVSGSPNAAEDNGETPADDQRNNPPPQPETAADAAEALSTGSLKTAEPSVSAPPSATVPESSLNASAADVAPADDAYDTPPWQPETAADAAEPLFNGSLKTAEPPVSALPSATVSESSLNASAADAAPTDDAYDNPPWQPETDANHLPQPSPKPSGRAGHENSQTFSPQSVAFDDLLPPAADEDEYGETAYPSHQPAAAVPINDDAPMPELTAANWPQITRRIGNRISAAQMSLGHMAWVDFTDGLLQLALVQEQTRGTAKKEYFDRIAAALSDAYGFPVRIETRPFEAGRGWETPLMYEQRQIRERRALARTYMEQDTAVQQLQALFQARWHEDSLTLLDSTDGAA